MVLYAYVCVYAFSLHRESLSRILGDKPSLFQGGGVCHSWHQSKIRGKHTQKHLKIAITLSVRNAIIHLEHHVEQQDLNLEERATMIATLEQ
jgi:hypothetical protein